MLYFSRPPSDRRFFLQQQGKYERLRWDSEVPAMKRSLVASLFVSAFACSLPAEATHLGPIVFGTVRTETVVLCFDKMSAMQLANEEQRSIEAQERVDQFFGRIIHLFNNEKCGLKNISYIGRETIHQWTGRMLRGEEIISTHMSIVRSDSNVGEVFVITPDDVPAPKKQP